MSSSRRASFPYAASVALRFMGMMNCSMNCAGAGIVSFAVVFSSSKDCTKRKCSTKGCSPASEIFPVR